MYGAPSERVCHAKRGFRTLRTLELSHNGLDAEAVRSMGAVGASLRALTLLDVAGNQCDAAGLLCGAFERFRAARDEGEHVG